MKSAASSASACERRKSAQVVAARSGAGSNPASRLAQDLPHRRRGDRDPEGEQFAVHSPVSPAGVLAGQAHHQGADRPQRARSAAAAGSGHRGVAAGEQVAVPLQDRVGSDRRPQPPECRPGQRVQQRNQPRPIGRSEPDLPAAELTLHHCELMTQRQDLNVLVTIATGWQSQQREHVTDTQVCQPKQHEPASWLSHQQRWIRRPTQDPSQDRTSRSAFHQHGRINRQAQRRGEGRTAGMKSREQSYWKRRIRLIDLHLGHIVIVQLFGLGREGPELAAESV